MGSNPDEDSTMAAIRVPLFPPPARWNIQWEPESRKSRKSKQKQPQSWTPRPRNRKAKREQLQLWTQQLRKPEQPRSRNPEPRSTLRGGKTTITTESSTTN